MLTTGFDHGAEALYKQSIPIPGKVIEPFQELAREAKMSLCFSAWERNGELAHNCCMLIGKDGELVGKYRKVHLASPIEEFWGVMPGNEFPVYQLGNAKVAMNVCMDSSALESARVPARMGAEILCMPIMGDHRSERHWNGLQSEFDLDRWAAIQRVRAMDNQLYMVISRNGGLGSGIFGPTGDILAMSGERQLVYADVDLSDLPKVQVWATFRGVVWWERREQAYWPLLQTQVGDGG
jgi:predicted amidohydrolase